ncbi:MAG TPA: thiamine diphosphokinase [Ignavibacteriales bacterium]|nr:thiamine diphosphokinase [Ignavibacteriales bacterium]
MHLSITIQVQLQHICSFQPRLKNYYDAAESSGGSAPQFEKKENGEYDFNSPFVKPETLEYYKGKTEVIQYLRQNDTDVEKCLKFAIKKKFKECVLLGVIGDRLDHSYCNLGIAVKFSDKINLKIISENSLLTVAGKEIDLKTVKNEIISLYGFDEKTKITSGGLKYKLNNEALPFGIRESTSNMATAEKVSLEIKGGKIFIIRDFNTVFTHDLF